MKTSTSAAVQGVVVLICCLSVVQSGRYAGFQELSFTSPILATLHFRSHVPDATPLSALIGTTTDYCARGRWMLYRNVNYTGFIEGAGSDDDDNYICLFPAIDFSQVKSLRYRGASHTNTSAVSLYPGNYFEGEEIFVTEGKQGITTPVVTYAATGYDSWRFFEGPNFDGNSYCITVPDGNNEEGYSTFGYVEDINLKTVGSLRKGCSL